jgi:hypothetical protein
MTEYTQTMTEYTERLLNETPRKDASDRFRIVWLVVIPLIAVLSQVYVPRFVPFLAYLELPLLITVHFALTSGGPIGALSYGMFIGLVQDSLSHQPIGMYGIVKTLVGFLFLLLPPVLLLGFIARPAGRDAGLRCSANAYFWAVERRRGTALVSGIG